MTGMRISYALLWTGAWWAAVLSVGGPLELWVVIASLAVVVAGLLVIRQQRLHCPWRTIIAMATGPLIVDLPLAMSEGVVYHGHWRSGILPLWVMALWALLAVGAVLVLPAVIWRPGVWEAFLAISGALAYYGGDAFAAITLSGALSLLGVAVLYGLAGLVLRPLLRPASTRLSFQTAQEGVLS